MSTGGKVASTPVEGTQLPNKLAGSTANSISSKPLRAPSAAMTLRDFSAASIKHLQQSLNPEAQKTQSSAEKYADWRQSTVCQ